MGDSEIFGMAITGGYLVSFMLSVRAWLISRRAKLPERWIWLVALTAMLFLGINKQLDLQTYLTETFRDLAIRDGWYAERRSYQRLFISSLAGIVVISSALLVGSLRRCSGSGALALAGVVLLGSFVTLRAASFHHVDDFLGMSLGGPRLIQILEFGGVAMILSAAARYRTPESRRGGMYPIPIAPDPRQHQG